MKALTRIFLLAALCFAALAAIAQTPVSVGLYPQPAGVKYPCNSKIINGTTLCTVELEINWPATDATPAWTEYGYLGWNVGISGGTLQFYDDWSANYYLMSAPYNFPALPQNFQNLGYAASSGYDYVPSNAYMNMSFTPVTPVTVTFQGQSRSGQAYSGTVTLNFAAKFIRSYRTGSYWYLYQSGGAITLQYD